MTPVVQTIFYDPAVPGRMGNCLQAAIASVLDLPLDEVPHFVQNDEDSDGEVNWSTSLGVWLGLRGLQVDPTAEPLPGEAYLVTGRSARGVMHMVVYRDGDLVHDPHPSGEGLMQAQGRFVLRARESD